jgi:hypothetical protein
VRRSLQQLGSSKQPSAHDAVVLDMGLYETPLSMLPSTATESGTLNLHDMVGRSTTRSVSTAASFQPVQGDSHIVTLPAEMQLKIKQQQQPQQRQAGPWARSLSVMSSVSGHALGAAASRAQGSMADVSTSSEAGVGCGQVRLYQLLSPGLAGRAVVFGSKLALCDNWRCIDPPYFAAPGAQQAYTVPVVEAQRCQQVTVHSLHSLAWCSPGPWLSGVAIPAYCVCHTVLLQLCPTLDTLNALCRPV